MHVSLVSPIILTGGQIETVELLVSVASEMTENVLDTVKCFGIEKIERIAGCWEMTIHTIGYKSLSVVDVSGSLPGIVCEPDFMTGGAELRCGGTHHGVVSHAEDGKSDNDAENDKNRRLDQLV